MAKLTQGIGTGDELILYLVTNSLKPSGFVHLSPLRFDQGYDIKRKEDAGYIYHESDIKLKQEHILQFKEILENLGLVYESQMETWQSFNVDDKPINIESMQFFVGKDSESLERLLEARSDEEIGLALGFPEEAVHAYGNRAYADQFQASLAKAQQAGVEIPSWLAYIRFVPGKFDIVAGNVLPSAEALGKKYQDFVRANNPDLARKVEEEFRDKTLLEANRYLAAMKVED